MSISQCLRTENPAALKQAVLLGKLDTLQPPFSVHWVFSEDEVRESKILPGIGRMPAAKWRDLKKS